MAEVRPSVEGGMGKASWLRGKCNREEGRGRKGASVEVGRDVDGRDWSHEIVFKFG